MFVAMIIPILLKQQKCFELLEEISLIIRKDLPTIFQKSFLTTYIYLHLHETSDVIKKCLEFTADQTGYTVQKLLKADQKVCIQQNQNYNLDNFFNSQFVFTIFFS